MDVAHPALGRADWCDLRDNMLVANIECCFELGSEVIALASRCEPIVWALSVIDTCSPLHEYSVLRSRCKSETSCTVTG